MLEDGVNNLPTDLSTEFVDKTEKGIVLQKLSYWHFGNPPQEPDVSNLTRFLRPDWATQALGEHLLQVAPDCSWRG